MLNKDLTNLNFCELLNYDGQPQVRNTYNPPLSCFGYCIDCDKPTSGIFLKPGDTFDQMSHGCDTSDFEALLGEMRNRKISDPIIFLLENPWGDYDNGEVVPFEVDGKVYKKQPPINHYYWTPNIDQWPENPDSLQNFYGPYFAYLMNKHGLNNIYITNLIKCNVITTKGTEYKKQEAISNCIDKWLRREIEIFSPRFVFCFGKDNVEKVFKHYSEKYNWTITRLCLYHPSAIARAQRYHKKPEQMIAENDDRIKKFLQTNT